ncbi:hypothetical protein STRIP9103_08211 [Streptomyces ipomoeae 91-03]|uniref:Uncharacterized protein n=1 Tax=Streptomyces ipomoeae 91-03 TaxID=698759 RepID=L1KIS3_9ACTN|nr:hypothetical protein STRIP9103_08211 [Streptomyces ipomoeae 91-03]
MDRRSSRRRADVSMMRKRYRPAPGPVGAGSGAPRAAGASHTYQEEP